MFATIKPERVAPHAKLPRDVEGVAYWVTKSSVAVYPTAHLAIHHLLTAKVGLGKFDGRYFQFDNKYWLVERNPENGMYRVTRTTDWQLGYRAKQMSRYWLEIQMTMKPGMALPQNNQVQMVTKVEVEKGGIFFALSE